MSDEDSNVNKFSKPRDRCEHSCVEKGEQIVTSDIGVEAKRRFRNHAGQRSCGNLCEPSSVLVQPKNRSERGTISVAN